MYTTDFAYDGPIFLVPLSPSYPSSPVFHTYLFFHPAVEPYEESPHANVWDEFYNIIRENLPLVEDEDMELIASSVYIPPLNAEVSKSNFL